MQILDVKVHTDKPSAPQALKLGESVNERSSSFDEALGSEQERRSIDDREQQRAAKIADSTKQTSDQVGNEKPTENSTSDEGEEQTSNDWHEFLQSIQQLEQGNADTDSADMDSQADTVDIEQTGLEADDNLTVLTESEAAEVSALLSQLGITLTAKEEQQLLASGELSAPLLAKINEAVNATAPNANIAALQQQLSQLTLEPKSLPEAGAADPLLTGLLSEEAQTELNAALNELGKGNPEALQSWLAQQNLPAEIQQTLQSLIEETANALGSLTNAELQNGVQDSIKASLADVLAVVVNFSKAEQGSSGQKLTEQDGKSKLMQAIQVLAQRIGTSETAATALTTQPQENKVLLAFSNAAQELRALVQEAGRDDSREFQLMRGAEQQLPGQIASDGPKNISPSFIASVQQPQANHPTAVQQAARAMPSPSQQVETPFEQARQNQQYIDIIGPQAPVHLKDQIAVMFNNRNQVAEMRLDPPELGRLNIRLQMSGEQQASVTFLVNTPQAREAIEHAMPRLREMLEDQGIQLSDANVREDSSQLAQESGQQEKGGKGGGHASTKDEELLDDEPMHTGIIDVPKGQIDYYV